jgi:hypothetical protein
MKENDQKDVKDRRDVSQRNRAQAVEPSVGAFALIVAMKACVQLDWCLVPFVLFVLLSFALRLNGTLLLSRNILFHHQIEASIQFHVIDDQCQRSDELDL